MFQIYKQNLSFLMDIQNQSNEIKTSNCFGGAGGTKKQNTHNIPELSINFQYHY